MESTPPALGLTGVLKSLLFGVEALDAPTFAAMSVLMVIVALLASYMPAQRASGVDPSQALRLEQRSAMAKRITAAGTRPSPDRFE
jgi:hypothetical protein